MTLKSGCLHSVSLARFHLGKFFFCFFLGELFRDHKDADFSVISLLIVGTYRLGGNCCLG